MPCLFFIQVNRGGSGHLVHIQLFSSTSDLATWVPIAVEHFIHLLLLGMVVVNKHPCNCGHGLL